jgi:hypothetical protein
LMTWESQKLLPNFHPQSQPVIPNPELPFGVRDFSYPYLL